MKRFALIAVAATALVGAASAAAEKPLCVGTDGGCFPTLGAALAAAHDGDTILVEPGTYAGGVTIDVSVDLVGTGPPGSTVVSGGGPVITIGSTSAMPTVSISNLTITGGVTSSNPQSPHCGPDVPTCGPGYPSATALGGGIEAFPGSHVQISRSAITGNVASPARSVSSVRAICPGNVPCPASFGDAAGIDNWGAMMLDDTTVSDNHASAVQSDGGGIVDEAGASLALTHSTVSGNTVSAAAPTGRFAAGGGIFVDGGASLTMENSSVTDNGSSTTNSFPHPYPTQSDGSTDQSNALGGGVFLADGSSAEIRNSHLDDNRVTDTNPAGESFGADAGLCDFGDVALSLDNSTVDGNSTIVDVLTTADSGPSGPSALEADSPATISHTSVTGNSITVDASSGDAATVGAVGFFNESAAAVTVDHSVVADNTATASTPTGSASVLGAGIFDNGPLVLDHAEVTRNTGTAAGTTGLSQGGGISSGLFFGPSPLTLVHTEVTQNALTGSAGVTLEGGGLYTVGFPVTLDHSDVAGNTPDDCVGC